MLIDLRRLAFDKNLNQSELGEILRIAQTQVSLMMNGRRDITQTHINLLVEHFGAETIAKYTMSEDVIEAVRRKKDSQIDKLIKQNGDALKSISDLISVIKSK